MTRATVFAFSFTALSLLTVHRAFAALYEFCPADLSSAPVAPKADGSAKLYGFQLSALSPRNVAAEVAFDTDAGWFIVSVPSTAFAVRDRHYTGVAATFVERDWVSPIMYVRFPKPLKIEHRWVMHARATGDDLGWEARGDVSCEPRPQEANLMLNGLPSFDKDSSIVTTVDKDGLDAAPAKNSPILVAQKSMPLKSSNCAIPFADATITNLPSDSDKPLPRVGWAAAVEVALQPDGSIAGAWLWAPSGNDDIDNYALGTAARFLKYTAGRAYCSPAPGLYLLTIEYPPDLFNH